MNAVNLLHQLQTELKAHEYKLIADAVRGHRPYLEKIATDGNRDDHEKQNAQRLLNSLAMIDSFDSMAMSIQSDIDINQWLTSEEDAVRLITLAKKADNN